MARVSAVGYLVGARTVEDMQVDTIKEQVVIGHQRRQEGLASVVRSAWHSGKISYQVLYGDGSLGFPSPERPHVDITQAAKSDEVRP
jgi:hypothetical protein